MEFPGSIWRISKVSEGKFFLPLDYFKVIEEEMKYTGVQITFVCGL